MVTSNVHSSATGIAIQAPVIPINLGRVNSASVVNSKVLQNEIMADVLPFDSAVKNPDEVILSPLNKKLTTNTLNPSQASAYV